MTNAHRSGFVIHKQAPCKPKLGTAHVTRPGRTITTSRTETGLLSHFANKKTPKSERRDVQLSVESA